MRITGNGLFVHLRMLLLALSLPFFLSACGTEEKGEEGRGGRKPQGPEFIEVTTGVSEEREIPAFIQASGTIAADESSGVAPKIAGKIVNISTDVGRTIKQGDVIARIDDRDARLRLRSAELAVRQAEARLGLGPNQDFNESLIPEVRAAAANYEQSNAELRQAEANESRYRELFESGDVAAMAYEQYRTIRDTARSRANASKEALEAAKNNARQNNQAIQSALAQVETAKQELEDTAIRAPFSGYVSDRRVAVGEFVTTATVVVTVVRTNPVRVQIRVSESDVPFVERGRTVSVEVEAFKGRKFVGKITAISPSLDAASRAATVEAQIDNNDNNLKAGMFATVRINKEGVNRGIYVSKDAVLEDPTTQSYKIFVIEDGVARLRVVQIGLIDSDSIQILSGLNPNETIATSNLPDLFEGVKVKVNR
jgi:RND family efflux transporter MFP subunit